MLQATHPIPRPGIGKQPLDLGADLFGAVQLACLRGGRQRRVGHRSPEVVRQPRRRLPGREAHEALAVPAWLPGLQAVQELGRLQDRQHQRAQPLGVTGHRTSAVGLLQDGHLFRLQRAAVGPGGEAGNQLPGAGLAVVAAGQRPQAACQHVFADLRRRPEIVFGARRGEGRQCRTPSPLFIFQQVMGQRLRIAGQISNAVLVLLVGQPAQHPGPGVVRPACGGGGHVARGHRRPGASCPSEGRVGRPGAGPRASGCRRAGPAPAGGPRRVPPPAPSLVPRPGAGQQQRERREAVSPARPRHQLLARREGRAAGPAAPGSP